MKSRRPVPAAWTIRMWTGKDRCKYEHTHSSDDSRTNRPTPTAASPALKLKIQPVKMASPPRTATVSPTPMTLAKRTVGG